MSSLSERRAADAETLRSFAQSVWCMFAEDLAMIPPASFSRLVEDLIALSRRSSADDLGALYTALNDPTRSVAAACRG